METLTKKKRGRKPKFTLLGVESAPIKAKGYPSTFPYQYANYWNKRNKIQVEVVFDKKNNAWFRKKI